MFCLCCNFFVDNPGEFIGNSNPGDRAVDSHTALIGEVSLGRQLGSISLFGRRLQETTKSSLVKFIINFH
jgi:predicted ATP-dependent serine protease